tara:strand:+ start:198 stop:944 length:747 start_codon:yes stop_codon:yes gene_type:complete
MIDFSLFYNDFNKTNKQLLPTSINDYNYLHTLLKEDTSQHPFKHLLFSSWIFRNIKDITTDKQLKKTKKEKMQSDAKANETEACYLKLLAKGESISRISKKTGRSRCYLKRLALLNELQITTYPRIFSHNDKLKIIKMAYSGTNRCRISNLSGASLGYIDYIISCEPGLVERRKKCRTDSKHRRCKVEILRYLRASPTCTITDLKKHCNASYYWLYYNNRIWLSNNTPKPTKPGFKTNTQKLSHDIKQ